MAASVPLFLIASNPATSQTKTTRPPAMPSAVRAACDMAFAIAKTTPGVSVRRRTGTFNDETMRMPIFGCGLALSGSFKRAEATGDAAVRLRDAFMAQGWTEMGAYSADGTDGTSFAFRKGAVSCLARGTWNGGAATASSGIDKVAMLCESIFGTDNINGYETRDRIVIVALVALVHHSGSCAGDESGPPRLHRGAPPVNQPPSTSGGSNQR